MKTCKRHSLLAALAIGFGAWLGCLAPAQAQTALMQGVTTVQKGVLTVGDDVTYPPYAYFNDAKVPSGFDPEFSRLIAQKLGLKPNIIDTRFSDLILSLRAGRLDMIASALYVNPRRAKQVDYIPYIKTGTAIMVLDPSKLDPKTPEDLCGLRVANIKGSSWRPKVLKLSDTVCKAQGKGAITMLEYPTSPEALLALKSRAADAMMEDIAVSHEMVRKESGQIRITSPELIYPIVIGLGVSKDNPKLKAALTQALDETRKSGQYQALLKKYGLAQPTQQDFQQSLSASND